VPRIPATPAAGNRDNTYLPLAAAQTFKLGALVLLDGSANVTECGADPATIYGIAAHDAGKDPQDATKVILYKLFEGQKFWMQCSADPVAANRGISYGVAKDADGVWYVDFTDTVATRVYVHDVDTATKRVLVSVLAANRQTPP
jgi:hypothetical protein